MAWRTPDIPMEGRIAIDEANAANIKIKDVRVHFAMDSQDDRADPGTAVNIAQKFADEKVSGVVGNLTSEAIRAMRGC